MGVVETGSPGAQGVPAHTRLASDWDVLVMSALDPEPLLQGSRTLLERRPERIAEGLRLLVEAWRPQRTIVAVRQEDLPRFGRFRSLLAEIPEAELQGLGDFCGACLVETAGVLVESVETVSDIADAVLEERPVTRRLVTCVGEVKDPSVVLARIGTSLREVMAVSVGPRRVDVGVICGGPLNGTLETDLDKPVSSTLRGIVVLPLDHPLIEDRRRPFEATIRRLASACSGCGFCTALCPVRVSGGALAPHLLVRRAIYGAAELNGPGLDGGSVFAGPDVIWQTALLCTECGLCDYLACPNGLSPRELIRRIKAEFEGADTPHMNARGPVDVAWVEKAAQQRVPYSRLLQRLHLEDYADAPLAMKTVEPERVEVPLAAPNGRGAVPTVREGEKLSEGYPVAEAGEVRIHASMEGRVVLVEPDRIIIER